MEKSAIERTIAAVWRIESARLLGGLVRMVRDMRLAEDLAWGRDYFVPWLWRRARGRTAGDDRTAKQPSLLPVRAATPASERER